MKYILCILSLLVLPCSVFADTDEIAKLKSWKQTVQDQLRKDQGELGLWKQRMTNTVLVSAGKSPIGGFTHVVPGQDPTLVQGWRDPMTKGDAEDNFTEATSHIQRLEDSIKAAEEELSNVDKKITALENAEAGGGGGGESEGGGGGGGY
jgi:hypothetical protein